MKFSQFVSDNNVSQPKINVFKSSYENKDLSNQA